jgi:hypothetical protein
MRESFYFYDNQYTQKEGCAYSNRLSNGIEYMALAETLEKARAMFAKKEKELDREKRIKAKLAELQEYKKQPLATIDVILRLEYEFQQIYNEIFETPFQVVG